MSFGEIGLICFLAFYALAYFVDIAHAPLILAILATITAILRACRK